MVKSGQILQNLASVKKILFDKTGTLTENSLQIRDVYGKDPERPHIDARGFKGAVVTATQFARLAGAPDIYELSFSAPRGLSGAPVMAADRVVGIIIGNRSTEMLVFSHREMVTEEREFVTERFEAMQLGIAIRSTELLKCTVPGMPRESLAAHLEAQGLLSLALGE